MFTKKESAIGAKKVFYWENNNTKKDVIVFLHGFPGNHAGLLDMAKSFKNYRVIVPDLPACGISECLEGKCNLENYSNWLESFLATLNITKPIIVGHSFGARVALVFASRHPEKAEKIILITPVVQVEGLIARLVSAEYKIAEILPENLKKMWLLNPIHRNVSKYFVFKTSSAKKRARLMAKDLEEMKHLNPQMNIELFEEFRKFSLVPVGEKVKTKSLIIAGEKDEVAPLASIQELAQQIANADLVVVTNAGHILPAERPQTTAQIIKSWLQ